MKKAQGQPKRKFVRATQEDSDEKEDSEDQNRGRGDNGYFVFPINSILEKDCSNFVVETQTVKMTPDTGAQVTLLPRNIYDKHTDIFPPLHKCSKPVYAYMSEEPLNMCGQSLYTCPPPPPPPHNTHTFHEIAAPTRFPHL